MGRTEVRAERPAGLEGLSEREYRDYWWQATQPRYQGRAGRERLAAQTGLPVLPPEIARA